jgi:CysZ protein
LSARVEELRTGKPLEDTHGPALKLVVEAVAGELGKLGYFVTRAVPVLFLFLIPGLNALAPIVWMLLGFWFLALEYSDYPMGNHDLSPRAQRSLLRKKRVSALSFGAGATVLMLIPVLNFAAMPATVIGATQLWTDRLSGSA